MADQDENALLLRVGRGDAAAAAEAIDRFGPLVMHLARKMLHNQSNVDDAVQEAFFEIWKSAYRFDPSIASARAFVAVIARRRLIDHGRSERARTRGMVSSDIVFPEPSAGAEPRPTIDDVSRRVVTAMARLDTNQQDAIRLSFGQGWSHQRIAEHLGQPLGTIKSNIRRGLLQRRGRVAHQARPRRAHSRPEVGCIPGV